MTQDPLATSQARIATLQSDATGIHWADPTHDRARVRATATRGTDEYELCISGGAYFLRRRVYRAGQLVSTHETTPTQLAAAEGLWADLLAGRAL